MTPQQYVSEWKDNAASLASEGHYGWMSEQLGEAKRVLEVGCGSGQSTCSLATARRRILALDNNEHCLHASEATLQANGLNYELLTLQGECKIDPSTGPQISLLSIDIFSCEVETVLPLESFDAVVCWLVGTHPEHISQHLGTSTLEFEGTEIARYREKVQRRVYELSQALLTSSGLVHIVDRVNIASWSEKDAARIELAEHQGGLAGPSYEVTRDGCFLRKLNGLAQSKIQHVSHAPSGFNGILVLASSKASLTRRR